MNEKVVLNAIQNMIAGKVDKRDKYKYIEWLETLLLRAGQIIETKEDTILDLYMQLSYVE